MTDELYNDAKSRLSVYALQTQLQIQIFKKSRTLAQYGFTTEESQSWFVFLIMCLIMRRTLELDDEDGCTLDEIAWEVQELIKNHYDFILSKEDCYGAAKTVVIEILCNSGSVIQYETGTTENEKVPLSFLSSPMVKRAGTMVGGYRMAEDGFRIMLGTREIEENMKDTISGLIMSLHVKSKNYKGALEQAKDEIDHLRTREINLRQLINDLKSNVLGISPQKSEQAFTENKKSYEEARELFSQIRRTVQLQILDAQDELSTGSQDEKLLENLRLMDEIDSCLKYSITVTGRIINALQDFLYTLRNELINQMNVHVLRKRTVRKDLYEPLIQAQMDPADLADLFHPLFSRPVDPILNPDIFLEVKQLRKFEEEETISYAEENQDETMESLLQARKEAVERMNRTTAEFLNMMLSIPGHRLRLDQFLPESSTLGNLSINEAREMFAGWSTTRKIDLKDLIESQSELDASALDSLYSMQLAYLKAAADNPLFHDYAWLKIDKACPAARAYENPDYYKNLKHYDDMPFVKIPDNSSVPFSASDISNVSDLSVSNIGKTKPEESMEADAKENEKKNNRPVMESAAVSAENEKVDAEAEKIPKKVTMILHGESNPCRLCMDNLELSLEREKL